jgi:hypothetical protein
MPLRFILNQLTMKVHLFWTALTAVLFLTPLHSSAQGVADALRYSTFDPIGSARALGTGNSLGALGADFSSASVNPAGLAWYRKSEFSFSPNFLNANAKSTLLTGQDNAEEKGNKGNFNIGNLGLVLFSDPSGPDWRALNFSFGINRLQSFHRELYYQGDSRGSVIDRFLEIANSDQGLNNFESELAFNAVAIYDLNSDNIYESDMELAPNALIRRQQSINTSGSLSEMTFSVAGNFKDFLMVGATIGVPLVRFEEVKNYDEEDVLSAIQYFDNLQYVERVSTSGVGINAKIGIIARPHQMLRIGAAVHTPTLYSLTDEYSSELTYNYTDAGQAQTGSAISPDGSFEYGLRSPWRFIGNAGVIIGKAGFITAEAEYVDYGSASLRFRDFPADADIANENIAAQLQPALQLRIGGEVAYKTFRFRAGAGVNPSARVADKDITNLSLSAGVGVRGRNSFVDLGYRRSGFGESYQPYLTAEAPEQLVDSKTQRDLAVLTVGFRF